MAEGVVNHCLMEVVVLEAPQVRYTQDNQTPVAEMAVQIDGLRPDDPPGQLKVVGWGNLAQDLQNRVQVGQRLVLEGRLRMSTMTRSDGVKEKRAEFTLARLHPLEGAGSASIAMPPASVPPASIPPSPAGPASPGPSRSGGRPAVAAPVSRSAGPAPSPRPAPEPPTWNTSPLVPDLADDDDEIPF